MCVSGSWIDQNKSLLKLKFGWDVPVIHSALGICRVSHYLVLLELGKIMNRIVDKNILCQINNIQSYKLVFIVQYFLIVTVSRSSE